MKTKYLVGLSLIFILSVNFLFRQLTTPDLKFILAPTATIVELFTGIDNVWIEGEGYKLIDYPIRIEKSCSGFIYLNMIILLSAIMYIRKWQSFKSKKAIVYLTPVFAYLFVIVVNSLRIITAIGLEKISDKHSWFPNVLLHELVGGFYFLLGLVLIYLIIEKRKISEYGNA
jgi:exosortase K